MGIRVLVVEDEDEFADFLVRGLREEGFTVEQAADGPAAWAESHMLVAVLIPAPQARSALHTPGRPGYRVGRTNVQSRVGASTGGGLPVRKVTFGGANSLYNYLARPDHA